MIDTFNKSMLLIFYSIIFTHNYIPRRLGVFSLIFIISMFIIDICCCMYVYDEMSHFRWNLKILYLKINCLVADISVAFLCCWEWLIWVNQAAEHLTKNWYDCRLCTFNQCFKLPLFLGECRSSMWNAQVNQNLLAVPTFFPNNW